MTPPVDKIFIALKAFISVEGKILILRESGSYQEGANLGSYDVPGGRLQPGERFDEALLCEVLEETGLSVTVKGPVAVNEWRPLVRGEQWQIVGVFFHCLAQTKEVKLSEDHDAFEWIDPQAYSSYPIINNLQPVFESFLKNKKEGSG